MLKTQTSVLQADAIPVSAYQYCVYGVTLHSDIQMALPVDGFGELAQISLRTAPASFFFNAKRQLSSSDDSGSLYKFSRLADHSSYVRWQGVGEFLVSARGGCAPHWPGKRL